MTTCSTSHDEAATPAPGTAPRAGFWIALEQNGSWGRQAAVESHLDPELGQRLRDDCSRRGGTFVLIRRPTAHADVTTPHRQLLVAYAGESPWLLRATLAHGPLSDPLDRLDLEAVARGDEASVRAQLPELQVGAPVLLVCTNGRRDQCCAVRGRRVALDAAALLSGRVGATSVTPASALGRRSPAPSDETPADAAQVVVWESSHLGGHRFAATGLLLPVGRAVARLDPTLAAALVTAASAGRMPAAVLDPRHDRGATRLPPPAQVAEHAVRARCGDTAYLGWHAEVTSPAVLAKHPRPGEVAQVTVRHTDRRSWTVALSWQLREALPESCGKAVVDKGTWSVVSIAPVERHVG